MSVTEGSVESQSISGRVFSIAYFASVAIAMAGWLLFLGWLLRGLFLAVFNAAVT